MSYFNLPRLTCALGIAMAGLHARTLTEFKQFGADSLTAFPWSTMVEVQPGLFYGTTSATSSSGGDGMLYGTTFDAGIIEPGARAAGSASVLFRSDLKGDVRVSVDFTAFNAGAVASPPTAGADGAIYGTVGFYNFPKATGIIYRCTLDGTFTVLHEFGLVQNYLSPLIQANDGNLCGVLSLGTTSIYEEIFRISPGGTYTPLLKHQFDIGGTQLGAGPDGKLYGVDGFALDYAGAAFWLNLDGPTARYSIRSAPRVAASTSTQVSHWRAMEASTEPAQGDLRTISGVFSS